MPVARGLAEYQVSRDPANAVAFNNLGIRYRYAGQFRNAAEAFGTAKRLNPEFAGIGYELGAAQLIAGDVTAAAQTFASEPLEVFRKIGLAMSSYGAGDVTSSDQQLIELIDEFGDSIAFYIAEITAYRGESDSSFAWLEKARERNSSELSNIIAEPLLASLHSDDRWLPFLEMIGKSTAELDDIEFNFTLPR